MISCKSSYVVRLVRRRVGAASGVYMTINAVTHKPLVRPATCHSQT